MILVLAHLLCGDCRTEQWTRVPFDLVSTGLECAGCGRMTAWAKPSEAFHLIPHNSPEEFAWFAQFPEAVVEEHPCR